MVNSETPYKVVWTPDFEEDVYQAAHYIEHVLGMPHAARSLLVSVVDKLDAQRYLPECALVHRSSSNDSWYSIPCGKFAIYYTIEDAAIKAIGFKHNLRA